VTAARLRGWERCLRRVFAIAAAERLPLAFRAITESIGGSDDVAAMRDAAVAAVRSAVTGDPAKAQQQQERAAEALAEAREIPIEQARTEVQQYTQQYQQVAQQAEEAADTAATAVSTGALVAFVALLLGRSPLGSVDGWAQSIPP
jgi:ribulose kinase